MHAIAQFVICLNNFRFSDGKFLSLMRNFHVKSNQHDHNITSRL